MTDFLFSMVFVTATVLMIFWLLWTRAGHLNHKAGSVSRMWIAQQAVRITADPEISVEARLLAENLLEYAYNPMRLKELMSENNKLGTAGDEEVLSKYSARLGIYYDVVKNMSRHCAIITALNDHRFANPVRKIIEGSLDIETSSRNVGDDTIASDLAANFGRLDHGRASTSVIVSVSRTNDLAAA